MIEAVTASLRTANNPAVAILVGLVQGAGHIDTQFAQVALVSMAQRYRRCRPMWAFSDLVGPDS